MKRITRMLARAEQGHYLFPGSALDGLEKLVDAASRDSHAIENVGSLLKLIHVLRVKHESPLAADTLVDLLRSSPSALQVIALHWSSGRLRPRHGSDLAPVRTARAPYADEAPVEGTQKISTYLRPGQDLRSAHLGQLNSERKE